MKLLAAVGAVLMVLLLCAAAMLFIYPRPADTTDVSIFQADGASLDYCAELPLDGSGAMAAEIPKAYTPGCGWQQWPMPVLAGCTEPLAQGAADLRGLWKSTTPGIEHVERIEQCGNRVVVTTAGIIHDFYADGTLANGSRDVEPPYCLNTWAAIEWRDDQLSFRPFGLPFVVVTRQLQGQNLIWQYPGRGEITMEKVCRVPAGVNTAILP